MASRGRPRIVSDEQIVAMLHRLGSAKPGKLARALGMHRNSLARRIPALLLSGQIERWGMDYAPTGARVLGPAYEERKIRNPGNQGLVRSRETRDPVHWVREQLRLEQGWAKRTKVAEYIHQARAEMFALILKRIEFSETHKLIEIADAAWHWEKMGDEQEHLFEELCAAASASLEGYRPHRVRPEFADVANADSSDTDRI